MTKQTKPRQRHIFSRHDYIRVASFFVAALAVMCGLLIRSHGQTTGYHRMVVNNYKHAFNEVVTNVTDLDNSLQKCMYAGTGGMLEESCVEVYGAAMAAKQSLSEIPYSDHRFDRMSGFISRIGDYVFSLSKKASRGTDLSEEERGNLKSLSEAASVLSGNMTGMLAEINDGSLSLDELDSLTKRAANNSDDATEGIFVDRIKLAEDEFPEIPTLMYDGPFSSHIEGLKPLMLEGKSEVSKEDASRIAERFSGISGLKSDGERGGNLPVYMFSSDDWNVEVSKVGGVVVNMYTSRVAKESTIPSARAVTIAKAFLDEHGYPGMKESYRMTTNNVMTVNFAFVKDGVICYTDLIKVAVSLDSGKVASFEAQGYVMHHHDRTIPDATVTEEQAREKVSKSLKILSHEMTVIPTGGENEVFCHEFKCENESGQHYIVYVNAETGQEERILILLESANGTLTV